jgi:predicted acetyltransferase
MSVSVSHMNDVRGGADYMRDLFTSYVGHMHASGSYFYEVQKDGRIEAGGNEGSDVIRDFNEMPGMHPMLVLNDERPVGFSLILDPEFPCYPAHTEYHLGEFYIAPKARKSGLGKQGFLESLKLFSGSWSLEALLENDIAIEFWANIMPALEGTAFSDLATRQEADLTHYQFDVK